jgi:hypothetical protein
MLFQQTVNNVCLPNRLVSSLLTGCDNAVPTTCQQDCLQQTWSKLVNKLWQCCSYNLSTRFFATGLQQACWQVVTMLFPTSFPGSPHPHTEALGTRLCCSNKLVNKLWQCCSNNLSTGCLLNRLVASLLTSCDNDFPTTCQQDFSQQACSKIVNKLWQCCSHNLSTRLFATGL